MFDFKQVDHVLLDMDGTLLDRHFDNFFFEDALPRRYGAQKGIPFPEAQEKLLHMYRSVEGSLDWADLHYWSTKLTLNVVALTEEYQHLMGMFPDAVPFLEYLKKRELPYTIVTNAHPSNIAIKMAKTGLNDHVTRIVSAFEVGSLKMHKEFWEVCQTLLPFDPARTLYIDDDESCLEAGRAFGIRHLFHKAQPSSRLPLHPSRHFPSIEDFTQIMDGASPLSQQEMGDTMGEKRGLLKKAAS